MVTTGNFERPTRPATFEYLHDHGKLAIATVLGFAVLVVAALLATHFPGTMTNSPATFAGISMTPPQDLPAFTLERTDGTGWSVGETNGRLSLFFFGYTHCPDVCPLTLSRANQIHQKLGDDATKVDVYFVTVDPERDTHERLGMYVSQFNPAFTGLTGAPDQIQAAMSAFGAVAEKQHHTNGSGYSVDHTASSYLVDASGRIRLTYPHDAPAADVVADIHLLLDQGIER